LPDDGTFGLGILATMLDPSCAAGLLLSRAASNANTLNCLKITPQFTVLLEQAYCYVTYNVVSYSK